MNPTPRGTAVWLIWLLFWILLIIYVLHRPTEAADTARAVGTWLSKASDSVVTFLHQATGDHR